MFGAFLPNHPLTGVLVPGTMGIASLISTTVDSVDDVTDSHTLMHGPEGAGNSRYATTSSNSEVALSDAPVPAPEHNLFINIRYMVGA